MRGKVSASQLSRRAYVYVRQSTAAQVFEHGESTKRQYALAERAVGLGWTREAVTVIDEDQGKSGATTEGRGGFGQLVSAVAHGEAGAVLAIEVSRLARSSEDWQRLLSLCAVAQVAVIDEQTIYDPADRDDKLLLDLKGTMSEAELHWLGLRLCGARRNKARRGELRLPPPTGYVWREGGLALDPDEAVQGAVRVVLERFEVEPSAWAVVRWARETGLSFPARRARRGGESELTWKPLGLSRLADMLHNPIYAGAYVYGRRPQGKALVNGEIRRVRAAGRDPSEWAVRLEGAHAGYITWERYLENQEKLRQNGGRPGGVTRGAPREGAALLVGVLVCGKCGRKMRACYEARHTGRYAYFCGGDRDKGQVLCWTTPGAPLDRAVERLFLETMVPDELELGLAVEREAGGQAEGLSKQWRARIEQAGYEARRAERRYKAVDPDNRVVARTLEHEWEERLRELQEVEQQFARAGREKRVELTAEDRARVRALAKDLPAVWRAATTQPAERKAMLRLVIEAVALSPVEVPRRTTRVCVQWQSGAVTELCVERPNRRERAATPARAAVRLRELAEAGVRDEEIARQLDAEGEVTGQGKSWNVTAVKWVRQRRGIKQVAPHAPRREPLPERHGDGSYSVLGAAKLLGVSTNVVRGWIDRGLVTGRREPHWPYASVWWLQLDEVTTARLKASTAGWSRGKRR